ncbi:MAG: glycosyltransferase family 1 protein [Candidatus Moraniibacteriota bacterium]
MQIGIDIRLIGKKQTGSEAVFFNLVKNLALIDSKNNYQLFTDITEQGVLEKIKSDLGIENKTNFEIIPLETKNKFSWNFWTLPAYLRAHPVELYLTQYITPFFVPKKIKILTIIHDISFCAFPQMIKFSDLFFLRTLIPLAIRRADKVIGVSRFTRDEILRHYEPSSKKVDYIYNAVADDFLRQTFSREKLEKIRKKYNLPEKFILYLGTLQPRKNIPVLIEAYAQIKDQLPGMKLVLAGGKGHNYDRQIDAMIRRCKLENGAVFFPGFITEPDKKAVMLLADSFCFPSLYEGFGIPILEAFACNVPCVVSEIPPHFEVAKDAALFFAPNDARALAEKLGRISLETDLRTELLRKEKEQLGTFSWQKTTQKMLRIFEEMRS